MTNWNAKNTIGTTSFDPTIFSSIEKTENVELDEATAGYTPAIGDVLCYDTADTNKHQKYNIATATHVILGVVMQVYSDNTGTPVVMLGYATNASVWYDGINITGTPSAAQKLALKNALREKGIQMNG